MDLKPVMDFMITKAIFFSCRYEYILYLIAFFRSLQFTFLYKKGHLSMVN